MLNSNLPSGVSVKEIERINLELTNLAYILASSTDAAKLVFDAEL